MMHSCASASSTTRPTATTTPAQRRDPDAAADAAQSRRPVRRALAHRRVGATAGSTQHEDAFGNIIHTFTADGPFDELDRARSRARSRPQDTDGVVRGAVERFPPSLFLRETPLTARRRRDRGLRARASRRRRRRRRSTLLHALLDAAARRRSTFDTDPTDAGDHGAPRPSRSSAASARTSRHIFIAARAQLGIPARYVGGYFHRADGVVEQEAGHAWAEALCRRTSAGSGSTPPTASAPTDAHVRVAVGLDYLGAAPVRGTRYGGGGEALAVDVSRRPGAAAVAELSRLQPLPRRRARYNRAGLGERLRMTYCCGILVRDGLVMIADTRTNAGLDNISTFRKLHVFEQPGERIMALATSGNLSISQSVVSMLTEGLENPETGELETLMNAPTMFQAAQLIGRAIRHVHEIEGARARRQPTSSSTCRSCSAARSRAGRCGCS